MTAAILGQVTDVQSSDAPFYTNDLIGILKLIGTFAAGIAAIYGIVKARITSDVTIRRDIDGVGGRVGLLETSAATMAAQVMGLERYMGESRQRDDVIQTRIGAVEEAQRNVENLIRTGQQSIGQRVQEIKDAITGDQVKLRERVVRLETISELRTKGLLKQEPEDE